jgi:hypothetical protein
MIEPYLDAAIRQAKERARLLKTKIPSPRSAELIGLQRLCETQLDGVIRQLDYLLEDPTILDPGAVRERIRFFRRALDQLADIETTGIAALNRTNDDDLFMNRLVLQLHQEIKHPLPAPVVTCTARSYFAIHTGLHLLEVPPAESDFLLHLPDLYHEIAHTIIATRNNPKVEPFQHELGKFLYALSRHFDAEQSANRRATGPTEYNAIVLATLERSWNHWAVELFCDLFATFTIGPAYAWAHFHLTAGQDSDPYDVKVTRITSHPPDQVRMEAILIALDLLGLDTQNVKHQWDALVAATGARQTPEYRKACPKQLLELAAVHAFEGTKKIGCRIVDQKTTGPMNDLLNNAWTEFWNNPATYHQRERQLMERLKQEAQRASQAIP